MNRINFIVFFFLLLAFTFFACTPKATYQPISEEKPASALKPSPESPEADWELDWEKTLSTARKEGVVRVYSTAPPETRQALSEAIQRKWGISVDFLVGRGAELAQKLITEQRNGLYLADIYLGGSTTSISVLKPAGVFASLKSILVLPEVRDTTLWYQNRLP